jgi:hypothetical protein
VHLDRAKAAGPSDGLMEKNMSKSETMTTDTDAAGEPRRRLTDKELDAVAGGFPGSQGGGLWLPFLVGKGSDSLAFNFGGIE